MSGVTPPDALQFGPPGVLQWTQIAWDAALGGWLRPVDIVQRSRSRLVAQIDFARVQVPLYAHRYRHLPPAAQVARADLPPLTKAELMADLEASLSDRTLTAAAIDAFIADVGKVGTLLDGRYAVMTSSGSTGAPAIFLHDRAALATYQALELFRFRGAASPAHMAARLMAGERYAMVAATGGHFAGVTTIEHLRRSNPWLAAGMRVCSLLQPVAALVSELNAFAPTLLATYPTAAEMLADEADAGHLHLQLAELWLGGETLAPEVRTRLARRFGCRVRDAYGASEFMSIGWDCGHGSLHVNADWVLLEPVDAQNRPVEPGTASHTVLLTNLVNRVQPLIRYDLGDSITVLLHVEGRHDDILRFAASDGHEVVALPLVLTTVLEEEAGVRDFQLVQHVGGRLELRLHGGAPRSAGRRARAALTRYLHAQGACGVKIEVGAHAPLASPRSGKLRRVLRLAH